MGKTRSHLGISNAPADGHSMPLILNGRLKARMVGDSVAATPPLVLTLEMDGESFRRLNELRSRFFPPERNFVPAHVTLFHRLPGERAREIKAITRAFAERTKAFDVETRE